MKFQKNVDQKLKYYQIYYIIKVKLVYKYWNSTQFCWWKLSTLPPPKKKMSQPGLSQAPAQPSLLYFEMWYMNQSRGLVIEKNHHVWNYCIELYQIFIEFNKNKKSTKSYCFWNRSIFKIESFFFLIVTDKYWSTRMVCHIRTLYWLLRNSTKAPPMDPKRDP